MTLPTMEPPKRRYGFRPPPPPPLEPSPEGLAELKSRRKVRLKRNNENRKLLATTINALGIACFGASTLVPYITSGQVLNPFPWAIVALVCHGAAHWGLRTIESEE